MEHLDQWSDEQILTTCVMYGEEARKWKNKFLGLLPEVDRRKLYLQKGFSSVVHFAQVIGGVSEAQVRTALRLDTQFEETPLLHNLFTSGEASVNKLARVASVATPENEEFLVNQVQILPQASLETLVRDIKRSDIKILRAQNLTLPTIPEVTQMAVQLDLEVANRLMAMQEKGINVNSLLDTLLDKHEQEIQQEKEQIGESCQETSKRHIPKVVREILKKEHGMKCSITTCTKPSEETHHTQRWSLAHKHDPRYMAPLCKQHHQIAHTIDLKVQQKKTENRKPGRP